VRSIDFTESLWNAVRRTGSTDVPVHEDDLVVFDSEFAASCATVLLLDVSHSMILYGEDGSPRPSRWRWPSRAESSPASGGDTLDVVLFGDDALPVDIADLPFAAVGPYHTNTKAGSRSPARSWPAAKPQQADLHGDRRQADRDRRPG